MSDRSIIGVRLRGESPVRFYATYGSVSGVSTIAVGDWLMVMNDGHLECGRVVLTGEQLILTEMEEEPPIVVRRAIREDLEAPPCVEAPDTRSAPGTQKGFGGPGQSRTACGLPLATSRENESYRSLKLRLPSMGDIVSTADGDSLVINVQLRDSVISARSLIDGDVRQYAVGDILSDGTFSLI